MSIGECAPGERLAGYGAVWQYCDPISANWITFAGQKDVNGPKFSNEPLETTSQDGAGWETYIPNGIKKIDDLTIEGDYLESQYQRMYDFFVDGTITRWRMVLNQIAAQPYVEFCAMIMDMEPVFPLKELATMSMTLKPSGAPERGELN